MYCTYPDCHNDWDENARLEALEQDVCQRLEHGIRNEKESQCRIVLGIRHSQIGLEALDFRISDVRPVEKAALNVRCVSGNVAGRRGLYTYLMRYSKLSHGISFRSSFHNSFLS